MEQIFTRQALELEQWRSRFDAGQALPGISKDEAADIVHFELGLGLSQQKIQKLISKSRITGLRNGGQQSYVSARRLFWMIRDLQVVANRKINTRGSGLEILAEEPSCLIPHCWHQSPSK